MKKLLLSLGTVTAASSPILAVVACSTSISDEQQKQIDKLTSTQAINRLERTWLEKLMLDYMVANDTGQWNNGVDTDDNAITVDTEGNFWYEDATDGSLALTTNGEIDKEVLAKMPHVQDAFRWFIEEQLTDDSTYFTNVKEALDEEPEFNEAYIFPTDDEGEVIANNIRGFATNFDAIGFNADYIGQSWFSTIVNEADTTAIEIHVQFSEGSTDFGDSIEATGTHPIVVAGETPTELDRTYNLDSAQAVTEWVMGTLFQKDELGLVNELFRMFLIEDYMAISRDEWNEVFGEAYRENNSNITGAADWEATHLNIQEESDFPLIKFGIDNTPFMSWSVTVEGDDMLKYAGAGSIADEATAEGHFFVGDGTGEVDHEGTDYPSIAAEQDHKTSFSRINQFGMGSTDLATEITGAATGNDLHIGYNGISTVIDQGTGILDIDSATKLMDGNSTGYYNGFFDEENQDITVENIEFNDAAGTYSLTRYVSLMPLFDETSKYPGTENEEEVTKSRFTYDGIQDYMWDDEGEGTIKPDPDGHSGQLSLWANDKDLLTWYFYQMSPADIWADAQEYFISEDGLDFRLGITSQFVYDVYTDLGIEYIEKV